MRLVFGGVAILTVALALTGCTIEARTDRNGAGAEEDTRRQVIQPEGVARLPVFSSAIRSGDFIFLSGQLGALPGVSPPQLVEGGIGPETRQTMENIIMVLDAAGATLDDLVKCTVFLADIADLRHGLSDRFGKFLELFIDDFLDVLDFQDRLIGNQMNIRRLVVQ